MKSVVLVSGGVDSQVLLEKAVRKGRHVYPVFVNYGQKHLIEASFAEKHVKDAQDRGESVEGLKVFDVEGLISGLIDGNSSQSYYVPGRNVIFAALAASWAESVGALEVLMAVNAADPDNKLALHVPDASLVVAQKASKLFKAGMKAPVRLKVPFAALKKWEIVDLGLKWGVAVRNSWSCFDPQHQKPCKTCPACLDRMMAFMKAGVEP